MRLYLLRHGEVETLALHYGHTDVPLSPRGRRQAEAAADALAGAPLSAVFSSDLTRAAFGAARIAERHGLTPHADPDLREMHLGCLDGLSHDVSRERHPELHARSYPELLDEGFPGGENLRQVAARALEALERIARAHAGEAVAVVAHNSVNRIALAQALGLPLERMFGFAQSYGCINTIDYREEPPQVELLNWTQEAPGGDLPGGGRLRRADPRTLDPGVGPDAGTT